MSTIFPTIETVFNVEAVFAVETVLNVHRLNAHRKNPVMKNPTMKYEQPANRHSLSIYPRRLL